MIDHSEQSAHDDALTMADLRPMLGQLNYQLRRIGLAVSVTHDKGVVVRVSITSGDGWTITCDGCAYKYAAGRAKCPKCPSCGYVEGSEKRIQK